MADAGGGVVGADLSGLTFQEAWERSDKAMIAVPVVAVLGIHLYLKTAEGALQSENYGTVKAQLDRAREALNLAMQEGHLLGTKAKEPPDAGE